MGCAFAMKEQTSQETLNVLLKGYELPSDLKDLFSKLRLTEDELDASISNALYAVGFSISSLAAPTLIHAVRHSTCWTGGLTLVYNLLYFVLERQKITEDMSFSDLTPLQQKALTAIYETEALWELGNMEYTVGYFFETKDSNTHKLYVSRAGLHAFITGWNVA